MRCGKYYLEEISCPPPPSYKSGDVITFGKHKGKTFDSVCQFDSIYIDWMRWQKLCDVETVNRRDRGEYKKKKLPKGYAIVFG